MREQVCMHAGVARGIDFVVERKKKKTQLHPVGISRTWFEFWILFFAFLIEGLYAQ